MLWFRAVSAAVCLVALASAEDSCPAGAGAKCSAAVAEAAREKRAPKVQPSADLISQELEELTALKQMCKDRIEILEDLRDTLNSGQDVSLPESHMKMLQTKLPLMSEVITAAESTPTGSADDYVFSKAVIHQEEPASFIKLLSIKSRSSASSTPATSTPLPLSAVVVAVQADGNVRLFSPSGELVLAFSAGHLQPVTHLAVAQSMEDSIIITADVAGIVRVHKVNARMRKLPRRGNTTDPKEEKVSQYLESQLNVTSQFSVQMQAPPGSDGQPCQITALAVGSQQGGKYFVAGDAEGKISVFSKNGTFTARAAASSSGAKVERLYPHLSHLLFHAGHEWGFINLDKFNVQHIDCPDFEGRVTSIVGDSQKSSRVLVADEHGVVWAFNLKEKKNCKVEHSFPKRSTQAPLDLASVDGFTIGLERARRGSDENSVVAINMSHVGKGKGIPSSVAWRRGLPAVRDWTVLKRSGQGDLIAVLSEDGREVEVLEMLMATYKEPKEDAFGNFKMPVIAVAIVLVLGYQYVKQKGKFGGGGGGGSGGGGGKGKYDAEALKKISQSIGQKKKEKASAEKENSKSGGDNPTAGPPRKLGEGLK